MSLPKNLVVIMSVFVFLFVPRKVPSVTKVYEIIAPASTKFRRPGNVEKLNTHNNIEVLASVPYGSPVPVEHLRCEIGVCGTYGMRLHPILKVMKMHKGMDLSAKMGTPVVSTSYGVVSKVQHSRSGYGNCVEIQSGPYKVLYAHLSSILVEDNQRVEIGDTLGLVGSSGLSTGAHLHYEVRVQMSDQEGKYEVVNPLPFVLGQPG